MTLQVEHLPADIHGWGSNANWVFPRLANAAAVYNQRFQMGAIKVIATSEDSAGKTVSVQQLRPVQLDQLVNGEPLRPERHEVQGLLIDDHADRLLQNVFEPDTYRYLSDDELSFCMLARPEAAAVALANPMFRESRLFHACLFSRAGRVLPEFVENGNATAQIEWVLKQPVTGSRVPVGISQEAADKLTSCIQWITPRCPETRSEALETNVRTLANLLAAHEAVANAGSVEVQPAVSVQNVKTAAALAWHSEQEKQSL